MPRTLLDRRHAERPSRRLWRWALLVSVAALAGCDWPMVHYDAANTANNAGENTISASNAASLKEVWAKNLVGTSGEELGTEPVEAGGAVYTAGTFTLYARSANDGSFRWSYRGGNQFNAPAVAGGVVYAPNDDGNLYALKASDGSLLWTFPTLGAVRSPVISGSTLYFESDDGNEYAVDASTGHKVWSTSIGADSGYPSAIAGGRVIVPTSSRIVALDQSGGSLLWQHLGVSPVIATADTVYADAAALNAATGQLEWGAILNNVSAPALGNGVLYTQIPDGAPFTFDLAAYRASDGHVLWSVPAGETSQVTVANGVVYLDGTVAYSAVDGSVLWTSPSRTYGASIANGTVFAYDTTTLHAYRVPGT